MKYVGKHRALELVKAGALLVDMRSPVSFRDGHVDGAINLPLRNFTNSIFPMDRKRKIVIYGDTVTDEDVKHGNNYAEVLGFSEVFTTEYSTLTSVDVPAQNKRPNVAKRRKAKS